MRLWYLQLLPGTYWFDEYDCTQALVVCAASPRAARRLAANNSYGDETREPRQNPWLSTKESSCSELKAEGKAQIIIKDFRAG